MYWCLMQGGNNNGPRVASMPWPINPLYRRDLGWLTPRQISSNVASQAIQGGTGNAYSLTVRTGNFYEYFLEHKDNVGFTRYVHKFSFPSAPGLFIWHRVRTGSDFSPTLIVADGSRVRGDQTPSPEYFGDPFPGFTNNRRISDYTPISLKQSIASNPYAGDGPQISISDITNNGTNTTAAVTLNYWEGAIDKDTTWDGVVTVGGDVTIPSDVTLTLAADATVAFAAGDRTGGGNDAARSELIVEGILDADAGGITFRSTNEPSNATDNDWYGIRVEDGGTVHLSGATIKDGYRCVQAHAMDTPGVANATLDNCGVTVNLSPPVPVVGQLLTAELEGTEGSVADEQWRWQWRTGADQIAWANLAPAASGQTTSYLPEIIDFDRMLRATVWYRNAANTYDHAQSAPTAGVVPTTPAKPAGFEVLSLDGAVLLRWEDLNDPSSARRRRPWGRRRVRCRPNRRPGCPLPPGRIISRSDGTPCRRPRR